ncbi:MAG: flagellar M-ring protein FliF [Lachnospiraceae bacterium]|nr:flagellar M-ring protein FliF [Lachnospiraceae bacterium]
MQNLKESWQNMPEKTRTLIKIIAGGTVVLALIAILALNLGKNKDYSTLFTGLNQEEAQQVVNLLQDEGIDYRYNTNDGAIRVPAATVDQTRANLLSKGYPKSGFTYDMYLNNTGLMTTESDKEQITLYDLQDRLGAQIRLFDGVQDAKVTISPAGERRFVMDDQAEMDASASVVVTMRNGSSLTAEKAQAVKGLISHAVRGLNMTNVVVYDADTMIEVGGDVEGASGGATDIASLTTMVETSIAANVRRVLEQLYGSGNVAVSVKGRLNMEKLIQESTQYTTPDKIDEEDKNGLLQTEEVRDESTNSVLQGAGGLVGADANADTPRYTNDNGTGQTNDSYANNSASRVWLYNMLKEQRQIEPGVLEDVSIGVMITTDDMESVTQESLLRLVANSAGIPVDTVEQKVTVIRAPGAKVEVPDKPIPDVPAGVVGQLVNAVPLPILIAIVAGVVLLLLLLLLLLLRSKRKKEEVVMEGDEFIEGDQALEGGLMAGEEEGLVAGEDGIDMPGMSGMPEDEEDEFAKNEEILNLRMQRSLRLKQNISEFVDQNPQIAAKLVQSWLRGEESDGNDRRKSSGARKQSR